MGKGQKWERGFGEKRGFGALGLWLPGFGLGNIRGSGKAEVNRLYIIIIVISLSCAAGSLVRAIWEKFKVYLKRGILSKYAFLPGTNIN